MKIPIRHIALILGIISVFISFLFFGREQDTYTILLLGGLVITGIAFGTILFGKGTKKSKALWTLILLLSIVLEQVTEPMLIKASFFIYVKTNQKDLEEINDILLSHNGTLQVYTDTVTTEDMELTKEEINQLLKLRKSVNAYMITKSTTDIYYGLWGFLDVRHGVIYSINGEKTEETIKYRLLTDKWYY